MYRLHRLLLACLLGALLAPLTLTTAQETTVNPTRLGWDLPTTRMDDSPLAVEELRTTEIACLPDGQDPGQLAYLVGVPSTEWLIAEADPPLPNGYWECRARVEDTNGLLSDWSNVVGFIVQARPAAPSDLRALD